MRVLILAESCNPDWPSLPVVSYKSVRALAEVVDVVAVTHVRNREAIERDTLGNAEPVYIDNEYIAAPMHKLGRRVRGGTQVGWTTSVAMEYLPYLAFERGAWRRFRSRLHEGEFDVVHRITPMSPTLPSPMASWSPVPFVLGPLNGGLPWPPAFDRERRREREWLSYVRRAYRLLPYHRSTYTRSAAVMASFAHTIADLPESARSRTVDLAEVGIDPDVFRAPPRRPSGGPLTFLFAGRLVPYKCPDIAIEAFARSELLRAHRLRIVGDGIDGDRLQRLAREHGLEGSIEFTGRLTQAGVGEAMREGHVFAFPSIRELGAGVVVEAMACGMACVVVDYGGPGGLVDESTGMKVPLGDREALIEGFRLCMERLAQDPGLATRLGDAARRFALEEYSWSAKAAKIVRVYEWALGRTGKPNFTTQAPAFAGAAGSCESGSTG